jgi:hypothetical protein
MTVAGGMTYKEAELYLGLNHHYIRTLVRKGVIRVVGSEEAMPNVPRILLSVEDVEAFKESRRLKHVVMLAVDDDGYEFIKKNFRRDEIVEDYGLRRVKK